MFGSFQVVLGSRCRVSHCFAENTIGEHVASFTFTVGLDARKGRPLGMYLNDNRFYGNLDVGHVSTHKSTLIEEWNSGNPGATIRARDQVFAINNKKKVVQVIYISRLHLWIISN